MRKTSALAVLLFAGTAMSAVRSYPAPQSFTHTTWTSARFDASADRVSLSSAVAFRFTVPALHRRVYCNVSVYGERSKPPVVSLLQPDGTIIGTAGSCRDGASGAACELSVVCPASPDRASTFVLLVEPGSGGATMVSAGVTAFDPHE